MTWLLLRLLPKALAYAEGGQRRYIVHALIAYIADLIVARTTFAEIAGKPQGKEKTVSDMLERLAHITNSLDPDYMLYRELALFINRKSPTGRHIKAVTS